MENKELSFTRTENDYELPKDIEEKLKTICNNCHNVLDLITEVENKSVMFIYGDEQNELWFITEKDKKLGTYETLFHGYYKIYVIYGEGKVQKDFQLYFARSEDELNEIVRKIPKIYSEKESIIIGYFS